MRPRPNSPKRIVPAILLAAALAVGVIPTDGTAGSFDIPEDPQKNNFGGVRLKEGPVQEDNDWNSKAPSQESVSPRKKKVSPGRKWKGSEVREDNDWNSGTPSQSLPSRKLPAGSKVEPGGGDD